MRLLTKEEYLSIAEDNVVAVEITDKIRLIADIEYNENTDEDDYTKYRINYYNWICEKKDNNMGLFELIDYERGNRAGGIYIYNHNNAFDGVYIYINQDCKIIFCDNDIESKDLLQILSPGYYIFVIPINAETDAVTITRNGNKFILDNHEIYQTYLYQKEIFIMEDIEKQLSEMEENDNLKNYDLNKIISNTKLMKKIADDFSDRDVTDGYWLLLEYYIKENLEVFYGKA